MEGERRRGKEERGDSVLSLLMRDMGERGEGDDRGGGGGGGERDGKAGRRKGAWAAKGEEVAT